MNDEFNLARFVEAQDLICERVYSELRAGRKTSHWMWFVFPQLAGLGESQMAQLYAISGRSEAAAYAAHPVLGARLRECTRLVNAIGGRTIYDILGTPDDLKFRSSMTLFRLCVDDPQIFQDALDKYYGGEPDSMTVKRL